MTDRPETPNDAGEPANGPAPSDGIDFAALVAEHNTSRSVDGREESASRRRVSLPGRSGDRDRESDLGSNGPSDPDAGRSRWWRIGYPVLIGVALLVVVPALVMVGLRVILDSSDGQLVKRVTDPTAPGYEAVVTKTPTAVVAIAGADGSLTGVALVALTSESSGGVLTMPPTLAYKSAYGDLPISVAWEGNGIEALADAVGSILDLSFAERIVVKSSEWASLVASAGTLTVTVPDPVRDAKDAVVFTKGSLQLKPEQVATFLDSKGPKDDELSRTLRQELLWKAWISQLHSSGAPFPGSTTSGLGRFVAALSHGQVSVSSLPVTPMAPAPPLPQRYSPVAEPAQAAVAAIVPFPDGAPGGRPRMRVLDGTGKLGNGVTAAIQLNAAGGQVDVVGNYKSFGQSTTQILYFEGTSEATAQAMRDALDVGEIVASKESNSASDILVVLGEDYLAKYGPTSNVSSPTSGAR